MARTKEFEPSAALEKALKLFWRNGYERTSINDLVQEMGINRGSIYDTFGDKHALFLQALDRYSQNYMSMVILSLTTGKSVYPTLQQLFSNVVELVHEDGCNWGCFMTNTASELGLHDEQAASIVTRNFERLEEAFTACIEAGIASGELRSSLDAQSTGRYLTSSFAGLASLAKTNLTKSFLNDVISTTLAVLKE
ncbi:TetR/AcrR family transcriptional regulator [Paenibacillus sp. HB172176]|uniref:TetR/AcrR family transcriptional regulator n=1 Tax=Paenibacillus sp. HB172176 TaxID=2493690 RepID=UPI001438D7DF|nr:TetR/AcrR family transcriptional regulator [Paenibacillus sp. HB172176]